MTICQDCGNDYSRIATHWSMSGCSYPPLSQEQKEIAVGLLMGDGSLDRSSKNACLVANMKSKEYLKYVDNIFGIFGQGVRENQDGIFTWSSMRHPELQDLASWYESGKKVWPKDISMTPTVLKHLYAGDGHWANSGSSDYIIISMWNEVENQQKVDRIFENSELPSPSNYVVYDNGGIEHYCNAEWNKEDSRKLWKYMGKPLPEFEYKWPEDLS